MDASTGTDPDGDRRRGGPHPRPPRALLCPPAHAQTADKELFQLKKVADGVYAAIAETRYKLNCNAAVIMTDDGVIVVDSHSTPSAARALYQEIQTVTKKPVRKMINTHFHWDHWQGNEDTLDEMKGKIAEQLAPKYEQGMSKYPLGRYRNSIGTNIEMVHKKVVKKT
jgi:glyoxylase-like metal-dependent hydrolase (beta-lactamase superfamily II)